MTNLKIAKLIGTTVCTIFYNIYNLFTYYRLDNILDKSTSNAVFHVITSLLGTLYWLV